ncbi:MAG: TrmB family transcriptional regulator [Gammaproteobacteria bacterium]|nr:TrmB family transcriptional regulator [Gammaproteobacteria bacterium]
MEILQALQALGFTEYEARAYLALVDDGELNGYELAKASGIPRANVYAVADKLLQRGAAQRLQDAGGLRYAAVPPAQVLHGIESGQKQALTAARRALARRPRRRQPAAVFTLRGDELLAKARQLIDAGERTLLIAIQPAEAARLVAPLRAARERGVAITTLCLEACELECGGCQGEIHRYRLAPGGDVRWLVLVTDRHTALIGQFGAAAIEGVVTDQRLVVELASAYIRQSLALATLGSALAGRFEGLLSQEAQRLLDRLHPGGDFPAYIQSLSGSASS